MKTSQEAQDKILRTEAEWQFSLDILSSHKPSYVNGYRCGYSAGSASRQDEIEKLKAEKKHILNAIAWAEKLDSSLNWEGVEKSPLRLQQEENERLKKALEAIKKHQEIVAGNVASLSTTYHIASQALSIPSWEIK